MNLKEKLQIIQSELKAPKNQYNSFGKYKYRSCEDIQEGVKPLLEKAKTVLIISDEIVMVGERYYVKATVVLQDSESEEKIVNVAYAREEESKKGMDGSQVTGASSSYARKYTLNGLFCIDDTRDSDASNNGETEGKKANTKPANPPQNKPAIEPAINTILHDKIGQAKINVIKGELERTGVNEMAICKRYKIDKIEDITEALFISVMKSLQATKSKEDK